jgi:hypothetical protein
MILLSFTRALNGFSDLFETRSSSFNVNVCLIIYTVRARAAKFLNRTSYAFFSSTHIKNVLHQPVDREIESFQITTWN